MHSRLKDLCDDYLNIVNGELKSLNLTRNNTFIDNWQKQVVDSLVPALESDHFFSSILNSSVNVDVGFGGGFPILVLGKVFVSKSFAGIDSVGKKVKAVTSISRSLNITNTVFYHENLKNVIFTNKNINIFFKAVGRIDKYLGYVVNSEDVNVYFYKGKNVEGIEGNLVLNESKQLVEKVFYIVAGNYNRCFLGYKVKKDVPRGTNNRNKLVIN